MHILENFIRDLLWAAFPIHANLIRCLWGRACLIELDGTNGSEDFEWGESRKTECVLSDNYPCFCGIDLFAFPPLPSLPFLLFVVPIVFKHSHSEEGERLVRRGAPARLPVPGVLWNR